MLLAVIGIWAAIFYINMLDEIYDSIDDGLENSKILIIQKVKTDSSLIHKTEFMESNYAILEIPQQQAVHFRDVYMDSTLYMQNEKDFEPVRILKTVFLAPDGKYYQLDVVSSMVEEDDLMEDLLWSIVWLYLILLASVLLINNVLLRKIWKPFYAILDRLKMFQVGREENFPPVKTNVMEFRTMNETVSDLLQRTVDTFNSQKQFIENASHELQTPLAISINKLELMMEKNTFSNEQLVELGSVIESLERLTRLNKALLLLSRIENRQFPNTAEVDLGAVARKVVDNLNDLAAFKNIGIDVTEEETNIQTMDLELAEILFSNLIKNAIFHNYEGGKINIRISGEHFRIENTSKAVALKGEKIFDRFYKNTTAQTSTGLGLAIAKSITDYYGFEIKYSYDLLHRFDISFEHGTKV